MKSEQLFTYLTRYCETMYFTFNHLKDVNIFVINDDIQNCHDIYKLLPNGKIIVTTDDCVNKPFISETYDNILDFKTRNLAISWDQFKCQS